MTEPLVVCIMLTRNRPRMAARAVMSWLKQDYNPARRWLYVLDSGMGIGAIDSLPDAFQDFNIRYHRTQHGKTIGALRNYAIEWQSDLNPDVFAHWDDDDWSHPRRLSEQVALLESSKAEVTGYYEAAFYDSRPGQFAGAWIYKAMVPKHIVGASMAFKRSAWERRKFDETLNVGEDYRFCSGCRVVGVSGLGNPPPFGFGKPIVNDNEPRLVASIHGQNTAPYNEFSRQTWRRAPELDEYCRNKMILEVQP